MLGYRFVEEIVHREDLVLLDVKTNKRESSDDRDYEVDRDRLNNGEKRG